MAIVILIKYEDGQTAELPIIGKITLGRSSSSDYKIPDTKMSAQHCSFSVNNEGQLVFEDLTSSNGSYINNSRIHKTLVKINDVIRIGNTLIKIDEKKLSPRERQVIGTTTLSNKKDKTLPVLTQTGASEKSVAKKIVLNKELLKKKKPLAENWGGSNENVIEQEESSGFTKMLKLEKKKKA